MKALYSSYHDGTIVRYVEYIDGSPYTILKISFNESSNKELEIIDKIKTYPEEIYNLDKHRTIEQLEQRVKKLFLKKLFSNYKY